jgi:hypothetical protein
MKITALRAIGQRKVYNFFDFFGGAWYKEKTNYKAHDNTSRATWNLRSFDEGLVPDLPRGSGRSIGGGLDVGEEASELTIVTWQSLHHSSIGYQHARTWVGLAKKAYPYKCNHGTQARKGMNATKLADECIAHECGVLQAIERWNYS